MIKIGILVISDSSFQKKRNSTTQDLIRQMIADLGSVYSIHLVPDEPKLIQEKIIEWTDVDQLDLILTTGGTGLSPRDNTPEATRQVIEKEIPGITEYARMKTAIKTPMAALSRSVCGLRRETLIINLPGSEKAVREWLECLLPLLSHAMEVIKGKAHRCGG